ncbi:hypothetical protein AKJ16_DCAP24163 [Drosera capensis]
MDSPASRKPPQLLNRCCGSTLPTSLLADVDDAVFLVAFLAIPFGKKSIGPPKEVPSRCKIVSSSPAGNTLSSLASVIQLQPIKANVEEPSLRFRRDSNPHIVRQPG